MPTELWRSLNYKTQYKYFINTFIREYDLSKANINALLWGGCVGRGGDEGGRAESLTSNG